MKKNIKLTVSNRIILINSFFSKEGNILEMTMFEDICEKLTISSEEFNLVEFDPNSGTYNIDKDKDSEKEFKFTNAEIEFFNKRKAELDFQKKINLPILDLCKKIK